VRAVADVRTVPKSRRHPHFRAESLAASLPERGIEYVHMPGLGGFRRPRADSPNGAWENESFRGYADYAMTAEFADALAGLRRLAGRAPTAVMCSEAVWWRCHRRLIADRLVAGGDEVLHIGSPARADAHALSPFALVGGDGQITYPPPQLELEPSAG
jgi:uncharacterized protein (DUF488 family)